MQVVENDETLGAQRPRNKPHMKHIALTRDEAQRHRSRFSATD